VDICPPPDVKTSSDVKSSADWGLSGIHLIAPNRGWAVGQDSENGRGVLLKYTVPQISVSPMTIDFNKVEIGAFLEKTVTVKNSGNGNLVIGTTDSPTITSPSPPFYIITDSCSGKSLAPSRACKVTYRFLPDSAGTFSGNSNIPSNGSNQNPVTVTLTGTAVGGTLNYIHLLSPSDGQPFTAGDYSNPPIFQWESGGAFASIQVQFSLENNFSTVPLKVRGDPNLNQLIIRSYVWKRVLLLPGANGGIVYWRVLAKKKDKTMVESDVFSLVVGPP